MDRQWWLEAAYADYDLLIESGPGWTISIIGEGHIYSLFTQRNVVIQSYNLEKEEWVKEFSIPENGLSKKKKKKIDDIYKDGQISGLF